VGKPEAKRSVGRPRRRSILKWILDRMGCYGLDRSGSRERPVQGSCGHGIEPSGSMKCLEVLE
jgi:hypothetical protein